ncbi:IS110 family transposase [Shinella zoogloeoides]|uniref:IS110 family transposase n=1 Tax=Shinella zoogloeoides TaxID=352475 RepID=UPI0028A8BE5C|nr:IS110 family transposase [Shinella zoogloeoides]
MTIHQTFVGCDIGKEAVDIFDPRTARFCRLSNSQAPLSAFAQRLDPATDFVVFEATGHCDRLLRLCLSQAGIAFARVNPKTARRFAEARGRLAKTDRIDARSLAEMGAMFGLTAEAPPCPVRERLAALARRRDQLVDARAIERKHLADVFEPAVRADIEAMIAVLGERIASIEAEIDEQMRNGHLAQQAHRLTSAPGVGKVTAVTLLAHMPELGSLSPKTAASLAGLAPFNDDSGKRSGRRRIKGGRPRVRKALYMAALGAIKASPHLRAFHQAVSARTGSAKAGIIAVARKLITILNAMQRDKTSFV